MIWHLLTAGAGRIAVPATPLGEPTKSARRRTLRVAPGPLAVALLPPGGAAASGLVLPSPPMRPHHRASLSAPSAMGLHTPVITGVMAEEASTRLPPLPLRDRPRGDPGTGRHRAAPTRAPPTRGPPPLRPHAGCPLGRNPLQFPDTPAEDRPAPHAWAGRARSPSMTRAKRRTQFFGGGRPGRGAGAQGTPWMTRGWGLRAGTAPTPRVSRVRGDLWWTVQRGGSTAVRARGR